MAWVKPTTKYSKISSMIPILHCLGFCSFWFYVLDRTLENFFVQILLCVPSAVQFGLYFVFCFKTWVFCSQVLSNGRAISGLFFRICQYMILCMHCKKMYDPKHDQTHRQYASCALFWQGRRDRLGTRIWYLLCICMYIHMGSIKC